MSTSLYLSGVKLLRTGADGGHVYIKGRGEVPNHGECDVYAFFNSQDEERMFASQFQGQSVIVEADAVEFTRGIGGFIWHIASWKSQ